MADIAERRQRWTERTAERRDRSARAPTFRLSRPAESLPEVPPELAPTEAAAPGRELGPFLTYLCLPWSYGDRARGDLWHRLQCRRQRHQIDGGQVMQVGGDAVFVERRCRWCGHQPES